MIYLDNAATTQMCWDAREVENDLYNTYGNPASGSLFGNKAKDVLETARGSIASRIGAEYGEVFFTSGATEGNNWAIKGAVDAWVCNNYGKTPHIITSLSEHHSVLNTVKALEERGLCTATYVSPDPYSGEVTVFEIISALRPETALVSIMYINNETGARNDVANIGRLVRWYSKCAQAEGVACHVLFHVDATQALGKIKVDVNEIGCDLLTASGHKFHAGKGCGIMYRRKGTGISNLMEGGGQQFGLRPGTENPVSAARMALALDKEELACIDNGYICECAKAIEEAVLKIEGAYINGRPDPASGIINVSFDGIDGRALLMLLEGKGVVCSAGSACSMGGESHVLRAMRLDEDRIYGAIRISVGRLNTKEEIRQAIHALRICVEELRAEEDSE